MVTTAVFVIVWVGTSTTPTPTQNLNLAPQHHWVIYLREFGLVVLSGGDTLRL